MWVVRKTQKATMVAVLAAGLAVAGMTPALAQGNDQDPPGEAQTAFDTDGASSLFVVVNKSRQLDPKDYVPADLVEVGNGEYLRAEAAEAFEQLQADAAQEEVPVVVISGYRSYDYQVDLHNYYVNLYGPETAVLYSMRPGHSEHQTGLALDLGNADGTCAVDDTCFAATPAGQWAKANAQDYGFIVRYPEGQTATTGINYEAWHLRYVGVETATTMVEEGIPTLEDFMGLPPAPTY